VYGRPGYGVPQYGGHGGKPYKGQKLGLPAKGGLSLASQWTRILARFLDNLILGIPSSLIWFKITGHAQFRGPVPFRYSGNEIKATLATLAVAGSYEVYYLSTQGATLGKRMLGLRVAQIADGRNPQFHVALLRWAFAYVPGGIYPLAGGVFQIVDALWCLWDPNRQCLHDKAASTVVMGAR
jgi:uncharacterized RDD family membrane protein YckC